MQYGVRMTRIAILAPIAWRTPPRHYGPREHTASLLTEGLVRRGLDVTLFATGDSVTEAMLRAVAPRGYEDDQTMVPHVWEALHIAEVFERAESFDLIHNHVDERPLSYTALTPTPVVTTINGFPSPGTLPLYRKYDGRVDYVSISDADRFPQLHYTATVHPGIDLDEFTYRPTSDDQLLFFGRIARETGAADAIEIARRAGKRLLLAGVVQDQAYFENMVVPHLDGDRAVYLGSVGMAQRDALLGAAEALLFPVEMGEPYGLSALEAMACGTPVIAYDRGSVRELIDDGVTGYLVASLEDAVHAVGRIAHLDRAACRRHVAASFSAEHLVEGYLEVYRQVLARSAREDRRPWGFYRVLEDEADHKTKRIVVDPGQRLSLQRHARRSEHWHVVTGAALVTLDAQQVPLGPGESIDIPAGTAHRVENTGVSPMTFIEVQRGDYFGEDDIERLEDDYGRTEPGKPSTGNGTPADGTS